MFGARILSHKSPNPGLVPRPRIELSATWGQETDCVLFTGLFPAASAVPDTQQSFNGYLLNEPEAGTKWLRVMEERSGIGKQKPGRVLEMFLLSPPTMSPVFLISYFLCTGKGYLRKLSLTCIPSVYRQVSQPPAPTPSQTSFQSTLPSTWPSLLNC